MAGPWEKYQQASGPWERYRQPEAPAEVQAPARDPVQQFMGDMGAGLVRGAGSIGATLLSPVDWAARKLNNGQPVSVGGIDILGHDRRAGMDAALKGMGADTESLAYQGGKLGAEVAGTLGVGGGLVKGATALAPSLAAKAAPLMDAIGSAGFKAGGVQGLPGLGLRSAGGAITGGAAAGLVDPGSAGSGAVIGGALPPAMKVAGFAGGLAADGVKKAGRAIVGTVPDEVKALAARAKELGIDIPADRLVNSRPLNAIAAGLNYTPFSGRAATEAKMAEQLNQAASRLMGENTPNINKALRSAETNLGGIFEKTLQENTVVVDRQLLEQATDVVNRARNELGDDAFRAIDYKFRQMMEKGATGEIDGKAAYVIKRDLDRIAQGNSPNAYFAKELKLTLMDALNRSLGPEKAAGFAKVREQYSNMLALEKLAKNGVEGEISVARLANLPNINNQPLQELADIAAQFVKAREGQHGAAQRAFVGMGAGAMGGPAALTAGIAAGRGANMLLNSNAVKNRVLGVPQISNALMDPALQGLYRTAPALTAAGQ